MPCSACAPSRLAGAASRPDLPALPAEPIARFHREKVTSLPSTEDRIHIPVKAQTAGIGIVLTILLPHQKEGRAGAPFPPEHGVAPERPDGKVLLRNRKDRSAIAGIDLGSLGRVARGPLIPAIDREVVGTGLRQLLQIAEIPSRDQRLKKQL